jgi:hypothetical protein
MSATVIAERVGDRGLTVLKDGGRELRPAYLPPDPASRTAYELGELALCGFWFTSVTVPVDLGRSAGPPPSRQNPRPRYPQATGNLN